MKKMAISKFKAECLAVLERVRRVRKPILITRFGKPIAEVGPPSAQSRSKTWIGSLQGTGQINGNIIAPVLSDSDWEALR